MKTFSAKSHEVKREWLLVDATDKVLGRLATEIARRLRGKHKPEFTPHVDTGDFIIVTNVEKLRVTGTSINNEIRRLRFARGEMTQQALADACGVTRQTIIALEAGRYAPSLELGFRIADALGVRIEDVFQWSRPE